MAGVEIRYKNNVIATMSDSGTKTLDTSGKYMEDNVQIQYQKPEGGSATLGEKTVNANGVYNASSDSLDGYSKVTVSVPASAVDSGTKNVSITSNGTTTENVVGYASASITTNVPNTYSAGDEGKVVSSGALVSQTAHADVTPTTSDQTIDTTLNNSIKVKGDADLVATNIKKDVEIFGVTGSYEGSGGGFTYDDMASNSIPSGEVVLTGTRVEAYAFAYRNSSPDWSVYAPDVTHIGQNSFRQCRYLTSARFPKVSTYDTTSYIFVVPNSGTRKLELIDWGLANVPANWASYCANLKTIILRKTSVASLSNVNALVGTPFASGGTGGTIYIPKTLYDHLGDETSSDYKAASNWATIDGYGTITWAKLEGSPYESPTWGH